MTAIVAQADTSFTELVQFHAHLDVIGVAAAMLIAYFYGLRTLAERYAPRGEEAVTIGQKRLFVGGVLLMLVVSSYPIHDIGEQSLYMFHMVEHLILALVVPPGFLLRPLRNRAASAAARRVREPQVGNQRLGYSSWTSSLAAARPARSASSSTATSSSSTTVQRRWTSCPSASGTQPTSSGSSIPR